MVNFSLDSSDWVYWVIANKQFFSICNKILTIFSNWFEYTKLCFRFYCSPIIFQFFFTIIFFVGKNGNNIIATSQSSNRICLFLGYPSPDPSRKFAEKRVSFDSNATNKLTANVLRTQSLTDGGTREKRPLGTRSLQETSEEVHAASEVRTQRFILFYVWF